MSIPESQLETWAKQGAIVTAKSTADSVKNTLNNYTGFPTNDYEVYLQGSYKNDTNIYAESDVDVVIQLNMSFYNNLNDEQKKLLNLISSEYKYDSFHKDVVKALTDYYGAQYVKIDKKCLKIIKNSNRLPADVIVTLQYRDYFKVEERSFVEGVQFWSSDNRKIINYPKQVYDNGVSKQKNSNNWFKPVVRIFKNMRRSASLKGPSYFIQCLVYNVTNSLFTESYGECVYNILDYLHRLSDEQLGKFLCQHEQFPLFGSWQEQWDVSSARTFIKGLISLWNNWGK